ncbi:hypothetical protein [Nocardioides marmoribigeumensis]|uniref:Uncharacterized protein n=1 Tax=Nocardioides marmoribigeumensis TaxID=433649 RepID=A0ABU2BVL2_9ACTN|nr:hypothetical protein [Nocardioides marmoribigeumensis]MDR7362665.1 hypothetical protein [Nocardioides marmoribigeumensis]
MNDLDVDDDPELRDALHAAVACGPPAAPLDDLLLAAHRARRGRGVRRAAGGLAVAAVAAAAVLAGTHLLAAPVTGGDDRTGLATRPAEEQPPPDLEVHVTSEGRLVASPGTAIERTVADPLGREPSGRSWGLVVRRGDTELWGLVDWSGAGTFTSVEPARVRFAAVEDWLDHVVAASTGTVEPHPVYFTPDGSLRGTGPTRVVAVRTGVDLGPAADGTFTAAAELRVRGQRRWVLARLRPGHAPVYVLVQGDRFADSLPALVRDARSLYGDLFSALAAGGRR